MDVQRRPDVLSHEVSIPMTAVIGLTGLPLIIDLTREQRDFVGTIRIVGNPCYQLSTIFWTFRSGKIIYSEIHSAIRYTV